MTTRDLILDAARRLFNSKGLSAISVRDLCRETGISTGNFTYHFPNKDKLVIELYDKMLADLKVELEDLYLEKPSITQYLESHKRLFRVQIKYKFIYLNLFEIVSNYPRIKLLYKKNNEFEREFAARMFEKYIDGMVIKKKVGKAQFERILNVGQILNNTWLVDAEILSPGDKKYSVEHYMLICCGLLEPYLTTTALREYRDYFKNM
jgi:AcrR family transcriptional regulator